MSAPTCDWSTGTIWSGPRPCGRPAKYVVRRVEGGWPESDLPVCGIHKRSGERWGHVVEPLSESDAQRIADAGRETR